VNLIAEKEVVKELIAHLFTVKNMANELDLILNNKTYREDMISAYLTIKKELGEAGTAERAAKAIMKR
jgi:lipid-A-disaccharide synthase